jgi:FKBP-type peptidyl-prolyl cis-trans isomerase
MKLISPISAGLASLGLLVAASAQDAVKFEVPGVTTPAKSAPAPAAPAPAPAPTTAPKAAPSAAPKAATPAPQAAAPAAAAPVKYTDVQLMEAYGYIFMLETRMLGQLQALEFSTAQREAMVRGISLAVSGKDLPYDPQQVQVQLQEFMGKRQQAFLEKVRAAQITAGNEYFAKLKENKNVITLPSGLAYEIVQAGKGAVPKPGQQVTIHYTGSLVNGQVFDDSRERGEPAELLLQAATPQNPQGVIAGMFEGLQKTGVGGKLKLHIPPALAYGDNGALGVIPPGATLIFDVEIVGAKNAPATPPAK